MIQQALNLPPASHNSDPYTSYIAEENHKKKGTTERECEAILNLIKSHPLHTPGELSKLTICGYSIEKSYMVVQKRVSILESNEKIKRSGRRKCEAMGTVQTVWDVV